VRSSLRNRLLPAAFRILVVVRRGGHALRESSARLGRRLLSSLDERMTAQGEALAEWSWRADTTRIGSSCGLSKVTGTQITIRRRRWMARAGDSHEPSTVGRPIGDAFSRCRGALKGQSGSAAAAARRRPLM